MAHPARAEAKPAPETRKPAPPIVLESNGGES
jgi:hypothetical protein